MHRKLLIPLTLSLFAGCGDSPTGTARSLVILNTTDEHSHLLGATAESEEFPVPTTAGTGTVLGGIGRRAAILEQERAAAAGAKNDATTGPKVDTLTVSAGDMEMGTLFHVPFATEAPDLTMMGQLKYDVATLGNHEFDFGPKGLASAIKKAVANGSKMQIVASTVQFSSTDPSDDDLAALYDADGSDMTKPIHKLLVTTTPNGLKVGFLGTIGPLAATYAPFKEPVGISVPAGKTQNDIDAVREQMYLDLQAVVNTLRNDKKVDVVVLLSHSGVDDKDMTKGEDYQIAQKVSGIDVIVSGHTHLPYPIMSVANGAKKTWIMQADAYGRLVGKIVVNVSDKGEVSVDEPNSKLIKVDDTVVANNDMVNAALGDIIKAAEADQVVMGKSFLETTLSRIEGAAVTNNPAIVGDLFFRAIGKTDFDIPGVMDRAERTGAVLVTDAHLAAAEKYATGGGKHTDCSVVTGGEMRNDIFKGQTGKIGFSDAFNVVSLGQSPVDGSVGYPLVRIGLYPALLKAALEVSAEYALLNGDTGTNYMITGGLKYEFDTTLPGISVACMGQGAACQADPTKGRITKMTLLAHGTDPDADATNAVIYDKNNPAYTNTGGWRPGITPIGGPDYYVVATSFYVATFAYSKGVIVLDPDTGFPIDTADIKNLNATILKRPDGSEVKQWESVAEYIRSFPNGQVPSRYNQANSTPRRAVCAGPLCLK